MDITIRSVLNFPTFVSEALLSHLFYLWSYRQKTPKLAYPNYFWLPPGFLFFFFPSTHISHATNYVRQNCHAFVQNIWCKFVNIFFSGSQLKKKLSRP